MIALSSIFRNSASYLDRYFAQVEELRLRVDGLRLVLAEGDSHDNTWDLLESFGRPGDEMLRINHGGPRFGSIDIPQRWAQIAQVVCPVKALACEWHPDVFVWVEADLIWDPEAMAHLIARAHDFSVAPMVFQAETDLFYDTWGYRIGGQEFSQGPPYFPHEGHDRFVKIDSCGSCFATHDLDAVREWDGHWPFPAGGGLWLDTETRIEHPA